MAKTPPNLTPAERRALEHADRLLQAGYSEREVAVDIQARGWTDAFHNALVKTGVIREETVH